MLNYSIPEGFVLADFIAACLSSGLRLEKEDGQPNPVGAVTRAGLALEVRLDDPSQANQDIVDAAVQAQGGSRA